MKGYNEIAWDIDDIYRLMFVHHGNASMLENNIIVVDWAEYRSTYKMVSNSIKFCGTVELYIRI